MEYVSFADQNHNNNFRNNFISPHRRNSLQIQILNPASVKHSSMRSNLKSIIVHINVNLCSNDLIIPVLCEVNSYAKLLPNSLVLQEIRQFLFCINFSILQIVFQPVNQILFLLFIIFRNRLHGGAMLFQLFFLNLWIRFHIDLRCNYRCMPQQITKVYQIHTSF